MTRRRARDINVFSLSLLDIIASALGAFLILYILASQRAAAESDRASNSEQQLQQLAVAAQQFSETAKKLADDNDALAEEKQRLRKQLAACQGDLEEEKNKPKPRPLPAGLAIGMCEVDAGPVAIHVWDHRDEDGDRVRLSWNDAVVHNDLLLMNAPTTMSVSVEPGANYLLVFAHNEGTGPPNTATIRVDPCQDGAPQEFVWQMNTGQQRLVSIVGR